MEPLLTRVLMPRRSAPATDLIAQGAVDLWIFASQNAKQ